MCCIRYCLSCIFLYNIPFYRPLHYSVLLFFLVKSYCFEMLMYFFAMFKDVLKILCQQIVIYDISCPG